MASTHCLREGFASGVVLDGRYEAISPINHGSFGMVFMAKDLVTGETVAIKCLTKKTAAADAGLDFAIDDESEELALHSRLESHPNIVNLIRSFETDAHVYLVLEFCARGDLYEAIRRGCGPLETEHVRQFMLELIDAVEYIHSKGVYHRDIKPENIFLTQTGAMKLGDFGLATTEKWSQEATVGSDRYMSPEQYDSAGAGYSPAQADIWAVGIVLLNVLFSRNPFTTPTEADPLFLDFSRDKQSLFDVFPSMSQDTYEVIVQCMNLDPNKRSLAGARDALLRVVSFTTLDEALDDFCSTDQAAVPTFAREPLRTPSIQSPQVDQGAFPWSKALQASPPQPIRRLSAIPDDETYSEELFPKSEESAGWFSGATAQTPSMSSILDSNFGASVKSTTMGGLFQRPVSKPPAKVSPMAGSLPINMSKPRLLPSLSAVFGRREGVSKSWSDMWEEEVEEEERTRNMQALKELNSRTWSHDSKANDATARDAEEGSSPGRDTSPAQELSNDIDSDLAADGFFFQAPIKKKPAPKEEEEEPRQQRQQPQPTQRHHQNHHHNHNFNHRQHSPPAKQSSLDKWAALGERRRAYTNTHSRPDKSQFTSHHVSTAAPPVPAVPAIPALPIHTLKKNQQHHAGFLAGSTAPTTSMVGWGGEHHHAGHATTHQQQHQHTPYKFGWNNKERAKECPWNKGRDWNWRKEKRFDFGDVEWVGGWQEAHS